MSHPAGGVDGAAAAIGRLELAAAVVGRYEILSELGRGGMAVVFLGRDLALDRLVAIKVLPPGFALVPSYRDRFVRESQTVAALSHPNIVPVHAVETRDTIAFFVMGLVEGESLAARIERSGPLPSAEVTRILREIGWALGYAHGRGVVHRDVKPHNILIEHGTGRALLTDFGIARVPESSLTGAGASLGTPHYMSPEQISGEPVDGRSDLYSLGVVGFQALTGRVPFDGESPQAILAMHLTRPAPSLSLARPGVPRRLAEAIDRCLAKEPGTRFDSADLLVGALPGTLPGHVEVAPPVRNFHRAASVAMSQVFLLAIGVPVLALLRPGAADLLFAVLFFGGLAIVLQLRGRAQALVANGYSYQDFRAAVVAERLARTEELAAFRSGLGGGSRAPHWSFWVALAIGTGLILFGILGPTSDRAARLILIGGLGVAGTALVTELAGNPRRRRGFGTLAAGFWASAAGRTLFRIIGTADPFPLGRQSGAETARDRTAPATWDRLTPATRRVWEAVHAATGQLDNARAEWLRQEEAIDRALASASWRESPASTGGDSDPAPRALLERRRELVAGMQASGDQVRALRQRAEMALDNLRLQAERLRSGCESPDDAMRDVAAAKEILALAPADVAR